MTAVNIIAQPKARAGYIIADCAYTSNDGTVVEISSKIVQGGGRFPWAFGVTGNVHPVTLGQELQAQGIGSLKQLERRLAPAMRRAMAATKADHIDTPEVYCAVKGVAWDFSRKRPTAFMMMSDPDLVIAGNAEPFTWYDTDWNITADDSLNVDSLFGRAVDFTDPDSFNPEEDGKALMNALRDRGVTSTMPGIDTSARHRIGGEAHLVTVTKHGVQIEGLCEWPDVVGERIRPHG